jgi:hypothetical protein
LLTHQFVLMSDRSDVSFIQPCEERLRPLEARREALLAEMVTTQAEWTASQGAREALEGAPIPWQDDIPDVYRRAAMETLVGAAIEQSGTLLKTAGWSCEEYPCIVAVEGRSKRHFDRFLAALTKRGFEALSMVTRGVHLPEPGRKQLWVVAYWDASLDTEAPKGRVSVRMDALIGRFMDGNGEANDP